ncbi:hypothetical protein [Methylobacterium fujisawaense]|uniref:hypothetical protein n=1 Tax=Methylobacterium fujisawaense TaxID=107400 RepID=UPI00313AD022
MIKDRIAIAVKALRAAGHVVQVNSGNAESYCIDGCDPLSGPQVLATAIRYGLLDTSLYQIREESRLKFSSLEEMERVRPLSEDSFARSADNLKTDELRNPFGLILPLQVKVSNHSAEVIDAKGRPIAKVRFTTYRNKEAHLHCYSSEEGIAAAQLISQAITDAIAGPVSLDGSASPECD